MKQINYKKMLGKANRACKRFTYIMGYGCLVSGIVITAKPYLNDLFFSSKDGAIHIREVPYKGEFFYDVQNSPGYQFVYLMETFVTYFIIIFSVSTHSIAHKTVKFIQIPFRLPWLPFSAAFV